MTDLISTINLLMFIYIGGGFVACGLGYLLFHRFIMKKSSELAEIANGIYMLILTCIPILITVQFELLVLEMSPEESDVALNLTFYFLAFQLIALCLGAIIRYSTDIQVKKIIAQTKS